MFSPPEGPAVPPRLSVAGQSHSRIWHYIYVASQHPLVPQEPGGAETTKSYLNLKELALNHFNQHVKERSVRFTSLQTRNKHIKLALRISKCDDPLFVSRPDVVSAQNLLSMRYQRHPRRYFWEIQISRRMLAAGV